MSMKPIIPWVGGKRRLLKHILPLLPPHKCYVELFTGGGALFWAKDGAGKTNVLNDKDGELINFYRVIAYHKDEFIRQFDGVLYSREMYNHLKQMKNAPWLTDIQRAVNFYARTRMSFAKRADKGQSFGTTADGRTVGFHLGDFEDADKKLKSCIIENADWLEVARRYDREHTLFFADPPYFETRGYQEVFGFEQYADLADFMKSCKGKVILTVNAHPALEPVFSGFEKIEVPIRYCVRNAGSYDVSKEWIIFNFNRPSERCV